MSEGLGGIAHSRPFHQTSLYVGYKNEGSVLRVLRLCTIRHLRLCTMALTGAGQEAVWCCGTPTAPISSSFHFYCSTGKWWSLVFIAKQQMAKS